MPTLKFEGQQGGGGGGGDVTKSYVDTHDAETLDSAKQYTNSKVANKQDKLTAGSNITIDANNKISATDTTYTAGTGLDLSGTEFSVDTTKIQEKLTAGSNITIDASNEISATDTTYTAGNGLDLTDTEFSVDSNVVALQTDLPTNTSDLTNDGANGDSVYVEANELATVATTGEYSDLLNAPDVNDATLTITQNGVSAGTFTANASSDVTIAVTDTTYNNFVGTDGVTAGTAGLVPAPATTDENAFLKGDGTWGNPPGTTYTAGTNIQINGSTISATDTTYTDFVGASSLTDGAAGLVPKPLKSKRGSFLKGDGTWGTPTNTTYTAGNGLSLNGTEFSVDTTTIQPKLTAGANVNIDANNEISATDTTYSNFTGTDGVSAGTAGLVPAPATTDDGKYLKADGTWATVAGGGSNITMTTTDPGEGQPLAADNFIAVYSAN